MPSVFDKVVLLNSDTAHALRETGQRTLFDAAQSTIPTALNVKIVDTNTYVRMPLPKARHLAETPTKFASKEGSS